MKRIEFLEGDLGCLFFVSTQTEGYLYRSFTVCDDDVQISDFHAYIVPQKHELPILYSIVAIIMSMWFHRFKYNKPKVCLCVAFLYRRETY